VSQRKLSHFVGSVQEPSLTRLRPAAAVRPSPQCQTNALARNHTSQGIFRTFGRSIVRLAEDTHPRCKIEVVKRPILLALAVILRASGTLAQQVQHSQGDLNHLNQRVQQFMDLEVGFEDMVPTGMSIEAKEVSRQGSSGNNLVVQYHIFVKGAPHETLFQQISWPVNADKPSSPLEGISVGKDGILMCAGRTPDQCGDPDKPDDPIEFTVVPIKGEPSRFAFVASNLKIGIVIVPDPITAKDKGCELSVVRLTPKFELALISGTGFTPNSDLHYRTSSETTNDHVVKSDSQGRFRVSLIPFAGKKSSGQMKVKITEATCSPEISYEWGKL
jgi:hypothetical protein